jgi:hypothetical protein
VDAFVWRTEAGAFDLRTLLLSIQAGVCPRRYTTCDVVPRQALALCESRIRGTFH